MAAAALSVSDWVSRFNTVLADPLIPINPCKHEVPLSQVALIDDKCPICHRAVADPKTFRLFPIEQARALLAAPPATVSSLREKLVEIFQDPVMYELLEEPRQDPETYRLFDRPKGLHPCGHFFSEATLDRLIEHRVAAIAAAGFMGVAALECSVCRTLHQKEFRSTAVEQVIALIRTMPE